MQWVIKKYQREVPQKDVKVNKIMWLGYLYLSQINGRKPRKI